MNASSFFFEKYEPSKFWEKLTNFSSYKVFLVYLE